MSVIKCKMCGGDIVLNENQTIGTCEYCGSTMTLPKIDDEQRAAAFNRGNHFRRMGEFDQALVVYERIVSEDDTDAEAHWCCALCRFGIEYVEDPQSHEWIPTCHRASFDSILDDVDYKAAIEHSDALTARRYRLEAERIAEVQRDILRLSQSEQPFDVFICYKESDDSGERTRDSVWAQDIYYQLTENGLRVFFSRITLEDKAGTMYEPYIFAALNSAKVMVVVATKPEYANAVWVKNEWNRFLALMKKDHTKLLIPCYRDMDPYDLPDQLSVLQAYDMSKIGFMQDLIHGISKVVDREETEEQKETVVVHAEGGANADALLRRGNMALEDGDWDDADGFFERVLDMDAECAEAYVGKFLAEKREPTLDAYLNGLLYQVRQVQPVTLNAVDGAQENMDRCLELYGVAGYLDRKEIEPLLAFETTYESATQEMQTLRAATYDELTQDRFLSRAVRFSKGSLRQWLNDSLSNFRSSYDEIIADAEKSDAKKVKRIHEAYDQHLAEAEAELKKRSQEALAQKREDRYQDACKLMTEAEQIQEIENVVKRFEALGHYKDSEQLLENCRKRITHLREAAIRAKRMKKIAKIAAAFVVLAAIVAVLIVNLYVTPSRLYQEAEGLLANGDYDGAINTFKITGVFKDAAERVKQTQYEKAEFLLAQGDHDGAIEAFKEAGGYADAEERLKETNIAYARLLLGQGKFAKAAICFAKAGDLEDAQSQCKTLWDRIAVRDTIAAGDFHTVSLKNNGTIVAVGENDDGQCDVRRWTNIVAIAAGGSHTLGLKSDGTVVAVGSTSHKRCDVSDWTDIVAIAAGGSHTLGLKSDGTVVAVGYNNYSQCYVDDWTDIVAIAAGNQHTVGLKSDGTAVAVGYRDDEGQCSVHDWTDIVAIAAGNHHTVGLKSDGTVVAVGHNRSGQCDVSSWTDIVAIAAGDSHTVGLKSDGTVVAVGYNSHGQCKVSSWTDIVAIAARNDQTVGLKSDGTVVAVGDNSSGQCDVGGWTDIKMPNGKG